MKRMEIKKILDNVLAKRGGIKGLDNKQLEEVMLEVYELTGFLYKMSSMKQERWMANAAEHKARPIQPVAVEPVVAPTAGVIRVFVETRVLSVDVPDGILDSIADRIIARLKAQGMWEARISPVAPSASTPPPKYVPPPPPLNKMVFSDGLPRHDKMGNLFSYSKGFDKTASGLQTHFKQALVKVIHQLSTNGSGAPSESWASLSIRKLDTGKLDSFRLPGCDLYSVRVTNHYRLFYNRNLMTDEWTFGEIRIRGDIPGYSES